MKLGDFVTVSQVRNSGTKGCVDLLPLKLGADGNIIGGSVVVIEPTKGKSGVALLKLENTRQVYGLLVMCGSLGGASVGDLRADI